MRALIHWLNIHVKTHRFCALQLIMARWQGLAWLVAPLYHSVTSTDVIGRVMTTGESRLTMFFPDTAAPTTGEPMEKPSSWESGATGNREAVRYRENNRPTASSVMFANTSPGSWTEIARWVADTLGVIYVVETLYCGVGVFHPSPFSPPLPLPLLLPDKRLAWPGAKDEQHYCWHALWKRLSLFSGLNSGQDWDKVALIISKHHTVLYTTAFTSHEWIRGRRPLHISLGLDTVPTVIYACAHAPRIPALTQANQTQATTNGSTVKADLELYNPQRKA